ncbi:hypothetical protein EV646_10169 [Kribbella antiqua]|uniref:NUDIX domain-containing protein n=1 Tax=Kribbella antiqua TaxID=2512217 RepID=A0A4R2J035_9ACTN|nr:hypothetical protein [Kribbella antiqua]TCO51087.1 hypothetical protein EV646_10169 [Kribbella antiqua]
MHFSEYDTRLAAYAVIVDSDKILLTWFVGNDHAPACWSMPGGGVEFAQWVPLGEARSLSPRADIVDVALNTTR